MCYVPLIQMGITKRRTRHSASSPSFPGAVHEYTKLRLLVATQGDDLSRASPHGLFVGRSVGRSVGCLAIHPSPLNRSLNAKYAHARPPGRGTFFCATVAVVRRTVFCAFRWCRLAISRVASPRTRHIFSFGIGFVRGRFRTTQIELSTAGNYSFDASIAVYGGIGNCGTRCTEVL